MKKKFERAKRIAKKGLLALLAVATISGTFGGTTRGLSPIYSRKTGNSYGINIGIVNDRTEGSKHYGISLGVVNLSHKDSELYGLNVSLGRHSRGVTNGVDLGLFNLGGADSTMCNVDSSISKVNGLQVGAVNLNYQTNGVQLGLLNTSRKFNGAQIGVANLADEGSGFQLGVLNLTNSINQDPDSGKATLLVNF